MALTYIWVSFFVISFVYGLWQLAHGNTTIFTTLVNSTFANAKSAFEIALYLTGTLAFWSGLMKIIEQSGLINVFAKIISPVFTRLYPELPKNHPVMGSILLNYSANMLGLDNASTPLGLKAMQELQKLNPSTTTASNSQIMFLVLNTSGLTIIPISIMMYRAQAGAFNPADIFLPTIFATICATLSAMLFLSVFQKVNFDKFFVTFIIAMVGGLIGFGFYFSTLSSEMINTISSLVSNIFLFLVIVSILVYGLAKKLNVYDSFIEGAKEGFEVAVKIIPFLVGILVGIGVFRESGAMNGFLNGLGWMLENIGLAGEYTNSLPVALMRPLSGSGSRGLMLEAFKTYGVDSFTGKLSSVLQGSCDTTFYILALYFGSVNIRITRHALLCGLFADVIGFISAIIICYIFFG